MTKPLLRVQRISLRKGDRVMVEVKYEHLPTFCYVCGTIGHIGRDCLKNHDDEKEIEKQWSSWLRASPSRGRQKLEEETKLFLSSVHQLNFGTPKAPLEVEKEPRVSIKEPPPSASVEAVPTQPAAAAVHITKVAAYASHPSGTLNDNALIKA